MLVFTIILTLVGLVLLYVFYKSFFDLIDENHRLEETIQQREETIQQQEKEISDLRELFDGCMDFSRKQGGRLAEIKELISQKY